MSEGFAISVILGLLIAALLRIWGPEMLMDIIFSPIWRSEVEVIEIDAPCVDCGKPSDYTCESCEGRICLECESGMYSDVETCKDEAACSKRIEANELTSSTDTEKGETK